MRIVIFEGNGGGSTVSQTIADGTKATQPSEPERQGYVFKGWYLDDGTFNNLYDFESSVTSDLTLYAKWARVFTVTFHNDGGNSINAQLIEEGQKITQPTDVIYNDSDGKWHFDGWYLEESLQNIFDFDMEISSDTHLYAGWSKAFDITFVFDVGETASQTVKEVSKVTQPSAPARQGYVFKGWYLDDGTFNNLYDFESSVTSDLTLYAKWTRVFTVTFHNDDGNSINAQLIEEGQKATEPADLSVNKSGDWRFGGWYIDEELQNTFDFDTEISSDVDLWAKWDQWFLIRFVDISGVNTEINDLEIKAGDTPENLPVLTRDGYDFKGWYNYYGTNKIDFNNVATSLKAFALWEKTVSNAVGHEGVFTLDSDAENWIDRAGYLGFKRWLDCEFKYVDSETVWCDPGMGYFLENYFDTNLSCLFCDIASAWDGSGLLSDFIAAEISDVQQKYLDMTGWTKSDLKNAWNEIKQANGLTLGWIDAATPENVIYYFENQLYKSDSDVVISSIPYAMGLEVVNSIKTWNRKILLTEYLDNIYKKGHAWFNYWTALKKAQGIEENPDGGDDGNDSEISKYSKLSDWLKANVLKKYGEESEQYWALINEILNPEFRDYVDCDADPAGFVAWIEDDEGWYNWSMSDLREAEFVEIRSLLVQWTNEYVAYNKNDGALDITQYSKLSDWLKANVLKKYGEESEQYWALINEILNPEFRGYVDCDADPAGFVAWIEDDEGWYNWSMSDLREAEFVEIRSLLVQWTNEFSAKAS